MDIQETREWHEVMTWTKSQCNKLCERRGFALSELVEDLGDKSDYDCNEVMDWLGY